MVSGTPPTSCQGELQDLLLKLQRQQTKQFTYIEKAKTLNKEIQKTSRQIARVTRLMVDHAAHAQQPLIYQAEAGPSSPQPALNHSCAHLPRQSKVTPNLPLRQSTKASSSSSSVTTHKRPLPQGSEGHRSPRRLRSNSTIPEHIMPPLSMPPPVPYESVEWEPAASDKCDLYLRRSQASDGSSLAKKPRSILFGQPGPNESDAMENLMLMTSLDGDLQFWDSSTRRNIKTLEKDRFFQSWIEDICWVTPSTLATCPAPRRDKLIIPDDNETVSLVHIKSVTDTSVDGRVQKLSEFPHEKGFSVISPIDLSHANTSAYERATFITGSYDKSLFIWDMRREGENDDFELEATHNVPIKHTSHPQTLCFSKYHNRLFSGGADEKFITFDAQAQRTISELKFPSRVNNIIQSPISPDLLIISLSTRNDQFSLYDQRCSEPDPVVLRFGHQETVNVSRYVSPDWNSNGHMIVCGSQTEPKIHFWDLRYNGAARGPCFSFETMGKSKILKSMFLPKRNTVLSVSSTHIITWTDYTVQPDSIIKTF
ncbi:WD40-repeat-containing domain protein [Phycomyces blakesleeanus]